MRLRKGNKVEIRGNADGLTVEWRCARIISGDGHTYSVQYDCSSTTSEASIERVSRKAIRPCPPLIKGIESWAANDHVEVYIAGSWRAATVLKVIGGDFYLVRLWVSCKEFNVLKVNMRARQSWQNGQWVVMSKVNFYLLNINSTTSLLVSFFILASILKVLDICLVVENMVNLNIFTF